MGFFKWLKKKGTAIALAASLAANIGQIIAHQTQAQKELPLKATGATQVLNDELSSLSSTVEGIKATLKNKNYAEAKLLLAEAKKKFERCEKDSYQVYKLYSTSSAVEQKSYKASIDGIGWQLEDLEKQINVEEAGQK